MRDSQLKSDILVSHIYQMQGSSFTKIVLLVVVGQRNFIDFLKKCNNSSDFMFLNKFQ